MPAPVITFTDSSSATLSSLSFGNVNAGTTSSVVPILIWNNKAGGSVISDTSSTTLTTVTFNGLNTGDTVQNGQEVVTYLVLDEQCTSIGGSYTQVGGTTTAPIGSAAGGSGTIKGVVGGDATYINLKLVVPSNITPGAVQFLIRTSYLYT